MSILDNEGHDPKGLGNTGIANPEVRRLLADLTEARAERDALRNRLGIVLTALRDFEDAVGEKIDDEGGDIAGIEAELRKANETL